ETVEQGLVAGQSAIGAIKIETDVEEGTAVMSCTVSIGWLSKGDLPPTAVVTDRMVFDALERAVAKAKRQRNVVIRFSSDLIADDWVSLRADCAECDCRFSFDVKRAAVDVAKSLTCPCCGKMVAWPAIPPPTKPRTPKVHRIC